MRGVSALQAKGCVSAVFAGLVHSQAQQPPLLRLRHQDFIASKLCFVALALAGAPIFIALRGVPTPEEAAIFALALLQLPAAMLVVRTGRLDLAHDVGVLGLLGIGGIAAVLPWTHPACAGAWFAAAAIEAMIAREPPAKWTMAIFALALLGLAVGACLLTPTRGVAAGATLLTAAAAVPALLAAWRAQRLLAARAAAITCAEAHEQILVANGDAAVIEIDPAGLVERASPNCRLLLGIDRGSLEGRGLFEHVQVADRPAFLKLVSDAAHGTGAHRVVLRLRGEVPRPPAGEPLAPHYASVEVRAARDPARAGAILLLRDVSEASREETAREQACHLVSEALRSRDEFLANISHELRTPLNAVIGFSEMLASQTLRPVDAEKQREYARIILQSGQHLLSVVNAILDMSKIQSGTFGLLPERFDVRQLVEQCREMMQLKADAGRVALDCDVPREIGSLVADRRACKQILINLLSNAVKFTPEGGRVVVAVRHEGTSLGFTVSDTGIGVAASDLGKLGQPFFQVNGSIRRSYEGTGLGLSVVRGLVELHGGALDISSEPGRGTTVAVRLPLEGSAELQRFLLIRGETCSTPVANNIAQLPLRSPSLDPRIKRRA